MSILRNITTPQCHVHTECVECADIGIACILDNGPIVLSDIDHAVKRESGMPIAREIETYETTFYGETYYTGHEYGTIGAVQLRTKDIEAIERGESPQWLPGWKSEHPKLKAQREILTYEAYVGRVVDIKTHRVTPHWDSGWPDYDTYLAVVAEADGTFREIHMGTDKASITVDALLLLIANYNEWIKREAARVQRERDEAAAEKARLDAEREANTPRKGRRVRVVKGRKVAKGTEGVVFWVGEGRSYGGYYSNSHRGYVGGSYSGDRIGIKDDAGTVHWTSANNVEVIRAEESKAA